MLSLCQECGRAGMNRQGKEDLGGNENTKTIMMDTCHDTFVKSIECKTLRMNPTVNYGPLWMIMTCQCRFIGCNKCTILEGMLIMGGAMDVLGSGGV